MKKGNILIVSLFFLLVFFLPNESFSIDLGPEYDEQRGCDWPCAVAGGSCGSESNSCETLEDDACGPGTGIGPC